MRGGHKAEINDLVGACPQTLHAAGFEDAQQLCLQGQRHVADFVKEQRSAGGLFDAAGTRAVGAGEGALVMAEKFAFQQFCRDGGAVHGNQRALAARGAVDGFGHEFLAGPGGTTDEDGCIGDGDGGDHALQLTDRGGFTDDDAVDVADRNGQRLSGNFAVDPMSRHN